MNDSYKIAYIIYVFIFLFLKNVCGAQENLEDPYQLVVPQEDQVGLENIVNPDELTRSNMNKIYGLDNEIVTIYMRTMAHWDIDFSQLEENRAGAACIIWEDLESIKESNGLFLSLGYSKNMATEEAAIDSAMVGCERMRKANNEEEKCSCEPVIINDQAMNNYSNENLGIQAQVAESLIDTNTLVQNTNEDQNYRVKNNIEINDLPEKDDISWLGLLSREEGGLGWLMWDGTNVSVAKALLNYMPTEARSPNMNHLMRRILLSRSKRPVFKESDELEAIDQDGNPIDNAGIEREDLLLIRIRLLAHLGEYNLLNELIKLLPEDKKDVSFNEKLILILLEAGDTINGCLGVKNKLSQGVQSLDYRKLLVACQLAEGELDGALLSLELIEQDIEQDDPFVNLVLSLTEEEGNFEFIENINTAMLVTLSAGPYGEKLSDNIGEKYSIPVLRAVAALKTSNIERQIKAIETLVSLGLVPPRDLSSIYASVNFNEEDMERPAAFAKEKGGVLARSLLFLSAMRATNFTERARYLRLLWDNAGSEGVYSAVAMASQLVTLTLDPRPDLAWFAGSAARALVAGGKSDVALKWVSLLGQRSDLDYVASGDLYRLLVLLTIAGEDIPEPFSISQTSLDVWTGLPDELTTLEKGEIATRLLVTLSALGYELPIGVWERMIGKVPSSINVLIPNTPLRYQLREAATSGRIAETALLSLIVIGSNGPQKSGPIQLNAAIRALRIVGLEEEARNLAIEATVSILN